MKLTGGPLLKARLEAASNAGSDILAEWSVTAPREIAGGAPVRTGRLRQSIRGDVEPQRQRAVVRGAYWGIFIDRGTKAHTIEPREKGGVLRFEYKGQTIFTKKVQRRRKARQPFITAGAQNALRDVGMADQIVQAWNRKRTRKAGWRKVTL